MRPTRIGVVPTAVAALAVGLFAVSPVLAGSDRVHVRGGLVSYSAAVPAGARAVVDAEYDAAGSTRVRLSVTGLPPHHRYAGRVHLGGCPAGRAEIEDVFQLVPNPDPDLPEDPAYRNRVNEVWFDLATGRSGAGSAQATQPWQFAPQARPGAVVLHEVLPQTRPTDPVVGAPVGCVEVGF